MLIFSAEKIRKYFLSIMLITACMYRSEAQIYGGTGYDNPTFLEIDITSCADCNNTSIALLPQGFGPEGGLALCSDGTFYTSFHEVFYTIDPTNGNMQTIPGMPT